MTTMWATLMIYEAMKNGEISEDAAKYFDGLIEKYSMNTYSNSIFDGYIHRSNNNTITYSSIREILDNLFDSHRENGDITIHTWSRYIDEITYDGENEHICFEDLLGIAHNDRIIDKITFYKIQTAIDENVSVINLKSYIKIIKQLLNYFKGYDKHRADIARLTELLEQGEKKLAELESSNETKIDN